MDNLKKSNSNYSQNTFNNTTICTSNRPQTAKVKDVDTLFNKSISNLKMFKQNPLFDDEDLMQLENNKNDIQNEETFSDDELNVLINQSITDINNLKDIRQSIDLTKLNNDKENVPSVLKQKENLISKSKILPPLKSKKK